MEPLVILGGMFLWLLLFAVCFWGGQAIIDSVHKSQKKKFGKEIGDPEADKKELRFYVILFFVGIPVLLVVALFLE